jgi:hypothetical protein
MVLREFHSNGAGVATKVAPTAEPPGKLTMPAAMERSRSRGIACAVRAAAASTGADAGAWTPRNPSRSWASRFAMAASCDLICALRSGSSRASAGALSSNSRSAGVHV